MNPGIPVDVAESRPDEAGNDRTAALAAGGTEIAVAALVCSVVWLFFLGSAAGLLLGILAARQLRRERRRRSPSPPGWAQPVATTAVALGAIGVATALVLGMLQLTGVLHLSSECRPAVTGLRCVLVTR